MPVWQKVQASEQPTWLEMQRAPRSTSGNIDRFDVLIVTKPKQPFDSPVFGMLLAYDLWAIDFIRRIQPAPKISRQGRHILEAFGTLVIEPMLDLPCAHAHLAIGFTGRGKQGLKFRRREAEQR